MKTERTEADKLAMAALKVTLGKQEYDIQPLRTLKQREWRKKLVEQLGVILSNFSLDARRAEVNVFQGGLISAMVQCPEKLADLLFAYAPDLPKDTILEESTEEQIVHAFQEVMGIAFPFVAVLKMTTEILKSELSTSPKPAFSN